MNFGHKLARNRNAEYISLSISGRKNYHTQRKSVKTNDIKSGACHKENFHGVCVSRCDKMKQSPKSVSLIQSQLNLATSAIQTRAEIHSVTRFPTGKYL